ncbi:MAG: DUF3006 domain-containing protein [Clostridia bacterium]|nr:DUF3006 domain-containing protein [Clostridia bacterium]
MKYIVERIEEKIASLENVETGEIKNFNISEIPFVIREGDVLIFNENVCNTDEEERRIREERIKNKMKNLWS